MSRIFLKNIGKKLRYTRKDRGLSQENLAELTGFSRNYIGMIERAEANPPIMTLYKIAAALDIEPWRLLKFDEE